jgi:type II secretory pathway pseudopilin PulG
MKENQSFNTLDSISVFSLIITVMLIVVSIFYHNVTDHKLHLARERTYQLALQLVSGGYQGLQDEGKLNGVWTDRGPASIAKLDLNPEGRIGMDPWGSPYYYMLTNNTEGMRDVIVLSSGPNRKRETYDDVAQNESAKLPSVFKAKGDDILVSMQK